MTMALSVLEFADKHADGLGALAVGALFVLVLIVMAWSEK